jgi:hypothetical protein
LTSGNKIRVNILGKFFYHQDIDFKVFYLRGHNFLGAQQRVKYYAERARKKIARKLFIKVKNETLLWLSHAKVVRELSLIFIDLKGWIFKTLTN